MLIRVEHCTAYSYSEPMLASIQYVRMTPQSGRTQAVEGWKLSCPGALTEAWTDQYGNLCHTLTVAQPVSELKIMVSGLVRTRETNGVVGFAPSELPSGLYLRETPYTVSSAPIRAYAARFKAKAEQDPIEALHDIMLAIGNDVEYRTGETHVHTAGAEALEQRSGVCQDHAHIFCAVCRTLGIPARYVSGYLETDPPPGKPRLAGADASHAWISFFCPDAGWIDVDPTNNILPSNRHVTVAWGRDFSDVSPIRGVLLGSGEHTLKVAVDVIPVHEPRLPL
jgi:transglutaminase-like putative cysteine protease